MKNRKTLFICIVLFLIIFNLWHSHASAYVVNKTGGADIKWFTPNATFLINSTGGPSNTLSAIQASMQTWTDVGASIFTFVYGGTSLSTSCGTNDGVNLVCFGSMGLTGTLAQNSFWYYTVSGQIIDSDIKYNTDYVWSTDGSAGAYDVQNVGTHEFGHSLSLADLYSAPDSEKTMYGYAGTGETKKRSLDQDDINGISYLYPDTTPPTGSVNINSGATYTNSTASTLTLTCTDSGTGCSQMQFSNDNSTWSTAEAYATTKSWPLSSGDGMKTVYAKFKDNAGNWSSAYTDTIVLDATTPSTTASPTGGTYTSAQSVTLTCNDATGSGCASRLYCLGSGCTPTTPYNGAINISSSNTLRFYSTDNAGNSESVKFEAYTIGTVPLEITTTSLSSGNLDFAYSVTLTATGGLLPYSWEINSGNLPNGLTLNSSTGAISGTPTATGIFDFTGRVTDTNASNAYKNLSIKVLSYPVRIGFPPVYYLNIQDAYDACVNGNTIQIGATDFTEDLYCDKAVSILLKGGHDSDYTHNFSYTIINGKLTISHGTVVIENLIIK
jgi:hypothetical protein